MQNNYNKWKNCKKILMENELSENIKEDDLIEKELFEEERYIKIKKKLVYEIVKARIMEISEILLLKNINFKYYNTSNKIIFLEFKDQLRVKSLGKVFKEVFPKIEIRNCSFTKFI